MEQEVPEGAAGALCTRAGLLHSDKQQALTALAFINGTFIPWRRGEQRQIRRWRKDKQAKKEHCLQARGSPHFMNSWRVSRQQRWRMRRCERSWCRRWVRTR